MSVQAPKGTSARAIAFAAVVAIIVVTLIGRLVEVQIVQGEEFHRLATLNQIRLISVPAPRGIVFDRAGRVLVRNRPSFVVGLIPSEVTDAHRELSTIAASLDAPESKLWQRILHHRGVNYRTFAEVQAYEPYGPVLLASDLSVAQAARIAELQNDLPGVDLEAQAVREYPMKALGSHIFGFVGQIAESEYRALRAQGYSPNDVIGKDGLEAQYDRYLRGTPGGQQIEVDASGQVFRHLARRPYMQGDSLRLTIDWRLQTIAEHALANELRSWGAGRRLAGALVIEDPWNGGILALASYPNFDPNDFAVSISPRRFSRYISDASRPLYNRAIGAATPTGSTFKMVTGSAALTEHAVGLHEVVYDSGAWNCGGALFQDIAAGGLGSTTFIPALAASSDGYFYQLSWRLGNARLRKYALAYGLNQRAGIDLPGEYEGNWPTDAWSRKVFGVPMEPSDVCSLGIGQGAMQATPLQMADIVSTVINGGTLYRPHVVNEIRDASGRLVRRVEPVVNNQVPVSKDSLSAVRAGMAKVTDPGGTAYGLAIDGLPFGGKTGTVETDNGRGPNTTWFIAYAPAAHPKLAMAVFVERSGGYGAQVAAPIAREILVEYFHKKGAP